jgi:hypothetical protein
MSAPPCLRHAGRVAAAFAALLWCAWVFTNTPSMTMSAQDSPRPAGWNEATHGNRAKPEYQRLFSMDRVHELHIEIAADRFRAMQADLATVTPFGIRRGGPALVLPRPGGGAQPMEAFLEAAAAACTEKRAAAACTANGIDGQCTALPPGGPLRCMPAGLGNMAQGAAPALTTREPMYVPVTVRHDGRVWTQVGMRYKGNSSLMSAVAGKAGKVPFRLDFDQYENEFPAIRNQRFYGFQKLTFSSGFSDDTQLNEVLASEVLRDRGVPAARAAFYRVYVDTGSGAEYWGLYSMIEDPADGAMLDVQFGGQGGNLYKPEGRGANWSAFFPEGFEKKTNKNSGDFSDVSAAIEALHASRDDAGRWRTALEARFDVDLFLRWLAVNSAIENWDAYGAMAHNYYLYADPAVAGRLRWIPWDHNMAFGFALGGRGRGGFFAPAPAPPGGAPRAPVALPANPPAGLAFGRPNSDVLHRSAGSTWPLISLLLTDDVYAARYREMLAHAVGGLLAPEPFEKRARELHALIAPAVTGRRGERPTHTTVSSPEAFERSLDGPDGLLERIARRRTAIRDALNEAGAR